MPRKVLTIKPGRTAEGELLGADETLAHWLLTGRATRIVPAETLTDQDIPVTFANPAYDDSEDDGWTDTGWEIDQLWSDLSDNAQRTQLLLRVIDSECSEEDRLLLWRKAVLGQTFEQLAETYEISKQAVHKRYAKLVARLYEAGHEHLRK